MTTATAPAASHRIPRWWWPVALLALGVAGYALRYVIVGSAAYVPELRTSFMARPLAINAHTLFGPIALVLGTIQLLPAMRSRRWRAHRILGRIYGIAAVILGCAGLYLSFYSAGGVITHIGFGLLAIALLITVVQGYLEIRRGDIVAHREWMLRSYVLIFAAVTLRLWQPLLIIAHDGNFLAAYKWVAWVSWVPNILFAEWIIRRGWRPSTDLRGAGLRAVRITAG